MTYKNMELLGNIKDLYPDLELYIERIQCPKCGEEEHILKHRINGKDIIHCTHCGLILNISSKDGL